MFFVKLTVFLHLYVLCQALPDQNAIITPCKSDDNACMIRSANAAIPKLLADSSILDQLGIATSDPLKVDLMETNIPNVLRVKFFNNTVTGFSRCMITKLNLNIKGSRLLLEFVCPSLSMVGDYEIGGQLISMQVEGQGPYLITSKTYLITIDAEISTTAGEDGKKHLSIKKFQSSAIPKEPLFFKFGNLFNGRKDLSDAVHKFAHENYEAVAYLVQKPIYSSNIKKIFSNINKYLKTVPLEDLIIA